jgi:hypothetical protein
MVEAAGDSANDHQPRGLRLLPSRSSRRRCSPGPPEALHHPCRGHGTPIPITELDDDTAATMPTIEVDADGRLTRIRLWDKNAALEKAMKHLGLYNRDNTQRSENLSLQVVLVGAPTNERD